MVARRHLDGCNYICGRYAARCHRSGLHPGNCRQLAMVVLFAFWHDDGFSVRALVAALWAIDGCSIRGNALLWKTRCVSARFSRYLPGAADELPDPWLGHQGNDQYRCYHHGYQRNQRTLDLCLLPDSFHRALCSLRWALGSAVDRPVPVCVEDEHRHSGCLVCGVGNRWHPSNAR